MISASDWWRKSRKSCHGSDPRFFAPKNVIPLSKSPSRFRFASESCFFFVSLCFVVFCFVPYRRRCFRKGKILDLIRNGDFRFDSFLCFLRFSRLRSHWPLSENGRPSDWRKNEFEERNISYESSLKKCLRSDWV